MLAAVEALLARYRVARAARASRPSTAGCVGYLGYDVVREVEHLPDVPDDQHDLPDAVLSIIGELAAFDHWRQRVTLIANALVPPRADRRASSTPPTTPPSPRLEQLAADGARPLDEPLARPARPGRRRCPR